MTTKIPSDPYEEGSNNVVIGIIRDFRNELATYEANNTIDRATFKASIEASIEEIKLTNAVNMVQLRKDFNRAMQPLMLETLDSRKAREDLFRSFNDDSIARNIRQVQVDKQFTRLIIGIVIIGTVIVFLSLFVVIRLLLMTKG